MGALEGDTAQPSSTRSDQQLDKQHTTTLSPQHNENTLYSQPLLNLNASRNEVLSYFKNTWALTQLLFSGLNCEEAYYRRPYHKTRHPLIFYYAHPVCFYVNKLLVGGFIDQPVNPEFELLFETGVDEMNWDDLHEGEKDIWPALADVRVYRQQVYDLVCTTIENHPDFDKPITMDSPAWGVAMGFEHERIHLETSSVLMRELPIELLSKPADWPGSVAEVNEDNEDIIDPIPGEHFPDNTNLVKVEEVTVKLGKPRAWPSFGWDNEYGSDTRHVNSFKASRYLISNGEFLQFVKSGGYENEKYWSESGWGWRRFRNIKWPTFWVQHGPAGSHRYCLRTIFEEAPMQWSWPAIVNHYEAKAYCAWRSEHDKPASPYRLLLESEHHAIRCEEARTTAHQWLISDDTNVASDPVMSEQSGTIMNSNLQYGSESPVDSFAVNDKGFNDVMGNVWQWCEDAFYPLPGFEINPLYTDFSTPCFDGEHQMILGGSFISTGAEASLWARFHFRPHFFQHAGFRLVQSHSTTDTDANKYETDEVVNQYLLFHFGSDEQQQDSAIANRVGHPKVGNLILRTAQLMAEYSEGKERALDLGCAVGRASFELSQHFGAVIAVDYSEAFIDVAKQLGEKGGLPYQRRETGKHTSSMLAQVPANARADRVLFLKGDASAIADIDAIAPQPFDAILLGNLLCRLPDPSVCLRQFTASDTYLRSGGVLVIASPNTWMAQYTDSNSFLDGEDSDATLAAIGKVLEGFDLLKDEDAPFMIREHRRKYEYIVSQVSVWKKR